tara:strand:+ start:2561 stop:3499 length:939 start_codon:yes stop_codon:yes gene_type:complete
VTNSGEDKSGWFARLKRGLGRSASTLSGGIAGVLSKRRLDEETLEALEELLITSDLGVSLASRMTAELARTRLDKETTPEEVRGLLALEVTNLLSGVAVPFSVDPTHQPHVVLVVGVNGTGKTTTIGKLAHVLRQEGRTTLIAAGDTFRAAAIEQLQVWGERSGADVIAREPGADAAGLAYDALERARSEHADVLLIDTAGRLHNKSDLMAELAKIVRVIGKVDPSAPHSVLLVLDATTGQNALRQVEVFQEICNVTGIVMTKLDGTARGGVLVAVAEKFGLPIHAIGVGEGIEDLRSFEAENFAQALVGLA